MSKRSAETSQTEATPLKQGQRPEKAAPVDEIGEFEDEFEDEYESEDEVLEAGVDGRPDAEREAEEKMNAMQVDTQTFIVNRHKLEAGQTLAPDLTTYEMLHALSTPWPCLSFDLLRDSLGDDRKTYPASMYAVAGTQAESKRSKENQLMVMKFSGLSRLERSQDDGDSSEEDEDDEDTEPILESKSIPLTSTTNRIRAHQIPPDNSSAPPKTLTASMTEAGEVLIHDVTPHLASFDTPGTTITPQNNKPLSTLRMHNKVEGYALDWSPLISTGKLVTGDNDGKIFVTTRANGDNWTVDTRPLIGHEGSVEELQWSPSERNVFASASSDGTIKVWDIRSKSRTAALSVQVSTTDVNVMSWSPQTTHLLASGAEDGTWAVWDLRQWKPGTTTKAERPVPVASYTYHKEQITSVEWHPTDDSIVAVAAGDNTITLWDLAVELDDEESKDTAGMKDIPPQLLFAHYLEKVKEVHWHPQIPGALVGTGESFNVFKTISV